MGFLSKIQENWFWIALSSIVFIWALFLGVAPLWLDEAGSYYYISRGSLAQLLNILKVDTGLPLYYIVLFFWAKVFGHSEVALRSFSYIFYVANIGLMYFLMQRLFSVPISRWSVVILALSSYMLNQAADARMYMLEIFLCLLSYMIMWSLGQIKENKKRVLLLTGLALVTTLGLYTHYWYMIFCAVQFLVALWLVRRWWIVIPYLFSGLCFLPWFKIMQHHLQYSTYSSDWLTAPGLRELVETFAVFMATKRSLGLFLFCAVLLLGIMYRKVFFAAVRKYRQSVIVLMAWLFGVIAVGFVLSQFKPVYYPIRYLIVAYPAFVGLLAILFAQVKQRWQQVVIIVCLFLSVVGTYVYQRFSPAFVSDRIIAEQIRTLLTPDTVLVYTGISRPTLDYYLRDVASPKVSFPLEQATHPAWYSPEYYLRQPALLKKEIMVLQGKRPLCLIYDHDQVSDQLRSILGTGARQLSVRGAYCQDVVLYY